jgi:hypothetical protein
MCLSLFLVLAFVSLVLSQSPPFASVQTSVSFRGGNSPLRTRKQQRN